MCVCINVREIKKTEDPKLWYLHREDIIIDVLPYIVGEDHLSDLIPNLSGQAGHISVHFRSSTHPMRVFIYACLRWNRFNGQQL